MVFKIKLSLVYLCVICTILTQHLYCQTVREYKPWEELLESNKENPEPFSPDVFLLSSEHPLKRQVLTQWGFKIIKQYDAKHFLIKNTHKKLPPHLLSPSYSLKKINQRWKLSPDLRQDYTKKNKSEKPSKFVINTSDLNSFLIELNTYPIDYQIIQKYSPSQSLIIEISESSIFNHLLYAQSVLFIQKYKHQPITEGRVPTLNLNVNRINYIHYSLPDLNGTDQIISIKEPLYDIQDIDLRNKHIPNNTQDDETSAHTTNMATIIAGAGNSSILGKGVAWNAKLSSTTFSSFFPNENSYYTSLPAYVQNHSYGTFIENIYDSFAQAYDQSTQENQGLLHVFSVGNQGLETNESGTYASIPGFATITGSFKMSKNSLVVASVDTVGTPDIFVSNGPAYDGRIKPELAAYSISGSSDAAALISGVSTLLQQAYQANTSNNILPSALCKAILINTAEDVGNPGPDFYTGFGNVNARKALETLQNKQWFEDSISANETQTFTLEIPENIKNLKITIVWNDPPASVNATSALVNDLDLSLEYPSGNQNWLPWVLNSFPDADSLNKPAQRGADHLNNVEQITLLQPQSGTYSIKIQSFDIPEGPQKYFVVYDWDEANQFLWTFPTQRDNMPFSGKRTSIFRWESSYDSTQTAELSISFDAGNSWQIIDNQILINQEYFIWNTPDTSTIAQARMRVGQQEYLSELFTISPALEVSLGFNCEDSLMLRWNPITPAQSYTVYSLGESFLEAQINTVDTFIVLQKNQFTGNHFAVVPEWIDGISSLANPTIDLDLQGLDCYLKGFSAFALESEDQKGEGVSLTLNLGTNYQVQRVNFERQEGDQFIPIQSINNPDSSTLRYIDRTPHEGPNTYRAQVFFNNQGNIVSETQVAYFIKELPLLIYPNPVESTQLLNLLSKDFSNENIRFRLNNLQGQLVYEQEINSRNEAVFLVNLQPGIYWYSLIGEQIYQSGRLVVRD